MPLKMVGNLSKWSSFPLGSLQNWSVPTERKAFGTLQGTNSYWRWSSSNNDLHFACGSNISVQILISFQIWKYTCCSDLMLRRSSQATKLREKQLYVLPSLLLFARVVTAPWEHALHFTSNKTLFLSSAVKSIPVMYKNCSATVNQLALFQC